MKMERTWIQDTLSVREERNIEIIRFAFGCKESWWRAFNSIFQCFFISQIQESTSFENCTRNHMKAFLRVQQEKLNHHFQTLWENYIYYENLHFIYVLHCFHIRNLYFHYSLINLMMLQSTGIHPWCLGSALSMIFFCFYLRIIYYLTISPISLLLVQMCLWYYLNIVKSMKCFYILIWETVKIIYLSYFYETLRWTL